MQEISDDRLLEITLIENIQREDLNPIELAIALDRMAHELNINQDEIGRRTGKDRSTISNSIRLLQLPPDLQQLVAERRLSAGHARSLLALTDEEMQRKLAEKIVAQGLSVRQVERMTKRLTEPRDPAVGRRRNTGSKREGGDSRDGARAGDEGSDRGEEQHPWQVSKLITTRRMIWTEFTR